MKYVFLHFHQYGKTSPWATRILSKFVFLYFAADWDLEIDPISVDDDDTYQCQVTLGYTSSLRSRKAKVEVLVPPQDPYINEGRVITVKESQDITLTCIAKGGKPAAKVNKL